MPGTAAGLYPDVTRKAGNPETFGEAPVNGSALWRAAAAARADVPPSVSARSAASRLWRSLDSAVGTHPAAASSRTNERRCMDEFSESQLLLCTTDEEDDKGINPGPSHDDRCGTRGTRSEQ